MKVLNIIITLLGLLFFISGFSLLGKGEIEASFFSFGLGAALIPKVRDWIAEKLKMSARRAAYLLIIGSLSLGTLLVNPISGVLFFILFYSLPMWIWDKIKRSGKITISKELEEALKNRELAKAIEAIKEVPEDKREKLLGMLLEKAYLGEFSRSLLLELIEGMEKEGLIEVKAFSEMEGWKHLLTYLESIQHKGKPPKVSVENEPRFRLIEGEILCICPAALTEEKVVRTRQVRGEIVREKGLVTVASGVLVFTNKEISFKPYEGTETFSFSPNNMADYRVEASKIIIWKRGRQKPYILLTTYPHALLFQEVLKYVLLKT